MAEWKECLLGDLITFQRGHDLSKSKMSGNGYPVVGSNGIIGFHNEYTTEYPSITVGRSGNVGKPYIVYGRSWSHNTSLYIKEFKGTDPIFIYYFLQTLDLGNYAGGSAVPTLNRNHIHSLNVRVPADVSTQEKIANTLKALDDKIDKNTDINKNFSGLKVDVRDIQFTRHKFRQKRISQDRKSMIFCFENFLFLKYWFAKNIETLDGTHIWHNSWYGLHSSSRYFFKC